MKTQLKAVRLEKKIMDSLEPLMKRKHYNFSEVVTEALEGYIEEQKLAEAVNGAFGAWKEKNHPEFKNGVEAYVRKVRKGRKF